MSSTLWVVGRLATTTCASICVAAVEDCPTSCEDGLTLCKDGSCEETCDDELETPCEFECASVACAKVVTTYDQCKEVYAAYYQYEVECGEVETTENAVLLGFNEPAFIVVLILLWCAFNQKIAPVPGSVQTMTVDEEESRRTGTTTTGLQIGYRINAVGTILYALTLITWAGWMALLAWLTIQYYALDGSEKVSQRKVRFGDEEQLLKTFIIVWSVGFVWCFTLKWPHTIQSLFLRRSLLHQASHVAVFVKRVGENKEAPSTTKTEGCFGGYNFLVDFFARAYGYIKRFMCLLFSDRDCLHLSPEGTYQICPVQRDTDGSRYFIFMFRRFNFDVETFKFVSSRFAVGESVSDLQKAGSSELGLAAQDVENRQRIVGLNTIEMPEPVFLKVVVDEFSKPFYTYQLFMIWSWFPLYYYYMALVWSAVVSTSGMVVAFFQYRNLATLHKITRGHGQVSVLRDGEFVELDQKLLVPGDICKIEPGIAFCDMVFVSGGATLVDESALTGEATPQAKTPIDRIEKEIAKSSYNPVDHKRHTISAGTTILESEESIGIVINTGSYTAKGELLRDIFSFRRHSFKFDSEVVIVLGILVLYAIVAFNIAVVFIEDTAVYGWFYGMYVVGTVLPPLLPTVFTVSVGVSEDRLTRKRIATVNPESILIAGKVKIALFDKTGTLTKQGLDFLATRSATTWKNSTGAISDELMIAMATCHSLTMSQGGRIIGNPVDQTMFSVSGGKFQANETSSSNSIVAGNGEVYTIVRHFDFDHHRMSQSVVLKGPNGDYVAYVKGSGESIQKMCIASSLPDNFDSILHQSAKDGIYQISVASKVIEPEKLEFLSRDDVESNLRFVGVIDFKNVIREDTPHVIEELTKGNVKSIIVTGDSVLAGIRVAKEAGIMSLNKPVFIAGTNSEGRLTWSDYDGQAIEMPSLDKGAFELAVSGRAWELLCLEDPKVATFVAQYARVFGRLTPHDKVSVIKTYVDLGFVTLMAGDGGNDVGALKAAHVGVALSDAEASIVAPFTSLDKTITSVPDVLKEGRCALASALATYKYIIMYGQTETIIQLISAYFQVTPSEFCWVFMDGIWTITLAFSLPLSAPSDKLAATRPTASILGQQTLGSTIGVLVINFIFTVIALALLWNQDWFQCRKWEFNDVSNVLVIGDNYETQVLFLVAGYQYVSSAIAFNFGYEFRQGWFRNYVFVAFAALYSFLHFYVVMVPGKLSCIWRVNCVNEDALRSVTAPEPFPIQNPFNTTVMPTDFRVKILLLLIFNTVATSSFEYFVVNGIRQRYGKTHASDEELERSRHLDEATRESKFVLMSEADESRV